MSPRLTSLLLALASAAYFVDLFLPWSSAGGDTLRVPRLTGWDAAVGSSGLVALALVLVELVRLYGLWRSVGASLAAFLLAIATGILALASFFHLHRFGFFTLPFGDFTYGAWIALGLAIVLLLLAGLRLIELRRVAWWHANGPRRYT